MTVCPGCPGPAFFMRNICLIRCIHDKINKYFTDSEISGRQRKNQTSEPACLQEPPEEQASEGKPDEHWRCGLCRLDSAEPALPDEGCLQFYVYLLFFLQLRRILPWLSSRRALLKSVTMRMRFFRKALKKAPSKPDMPMSITGKYPSTPAGSTNMFTAITVICTRCCWTAGSTFWPDSHGRKSAQG